MADKISIDLTQQEQLLLHIRTMVTSATQLSTKLKEGVDGLPALTSKGDALPVSLQRKKCIIVWLEMRIS